MYIASQRGVMDNGDCTMQCTLNYANYFDLNKGPIDSLHHLLEIQVKRNTSYTFPFMSKHTIVVIALYNSIVVYSLDDVRVIVPGEVFVVSDVMTIRVENNNQDDVSSFLLLVLDNPATQTEPSVETLTINTVKNRLTPLQALPNIKIASLNARQMIAYQNKKLESKVFLFNLNGAFEAAGCLLGPNDGLAIQHFAAIEIEAFEPNTIFLLVEL